MILLRAIRKLWLELREGRGRRLLREARAALASGQALDLGASGAGEGGRGKVAPDLDSPFLLTVSLASKKLRLYEDGNRARTYRVSVGVGAKQTLGGLYAIQNKFADPEWNVPDEPWAGKLAGTIVPPGVPENAVKARWLGVYPGVGIHGTDRVSLVGLRIEGSRGCIRMSVPDVIDLYDRVPLGTPVFIA